MSVLATRGLCSKPQMIFLHLLKNKICKTILNLIFILLRGSSQACSFAAGNVYCIAAVAKENFCIPALPGEHEGYHTVPSHSPSGHPSKAAASPSCCNVRVLLPNPVSCAAAEKRYNCSIASLRKLASRIMRFKRKTIKSMWLFLVCVSTPSVSLLMHVKLFQEEKSTFNIDKNPFFSLDYQTPFTKQAKGISVAF